MCFSILHRCNPQYDKVLKEVSKITNMYYGPFSGFLDCLGLMEWWLGSRASADLELVKSGFLPELPVKSGTNRSLSSCTRNLSNVFSNSVYQRQQDVTPLVLLG